MSPDEVHAVAERVDARLATSVWDLTPAEQATEDVGAAAEVAVFALNLSGKRRQARLGGRFSRLVVRFSLAACVALASVASACAPPSAAPEATAQAIGQLPEDATPPTITAQPRASPARFADLLLLDPGSDAQPWALLAARDGETPVLVDRAGAGLDTVGGIYSLAAQPVRVETRDGPSQFLDPLQPAVSTATDGPAANALRDQLMQRWAQDERYLAATRAIAGRPTVLDAAYNAAAAAAAGGTHTYLNGVVLRVEPDNPVVEVIDRSLLESGLPTRAEDLVYVAVRASETALYEPGQVVNLRDVVMDKQTTDVNGQPTTVYVANAALDGSRVEPTDRVDLQAILRPRMDVINQDLALQDQAPAAAATPGAVPTARPTAAPAGAPVQQPIIVQQSNNNGSAYIGDFLMFMWLTNGGFYRGGGGTTIINNYPWYGGGRYGGGVYYSPPPSPGGSAPSTIAASQAASRSTALEAARTSVSGQSSGTGGGVAATNKSAADATSRVSAATSKSAAAAGAVSASSSGKSVSSAPVGASSSTASRSAGSVSAGSRSSAGSAGSSPGSSGSSGGGKGIGGSSGSAGSSAGSGSSGGFGGKGVGGASSSSSS